MKKDGNVLPTFEEHYDRLNILKEEREEKERTERTSKTPIEAENETRSHTVLDSYRPLL